MLATKLLLLLLALAGNVYSSPIDETMERDGPTLELEVTGECELEFSR